MSVRSLLSQRCTIKRWATRTPDELGVVGTPAYVNVATDVPCLIQHHGARVLRSAGGIEITYSATGYFLTGTDVRPATGQAKQADRITLTRNGSGTFQTRGVIDEAGKGSHLAVALEAV